MATHPDRSAQLDARRTSGPDAVCGRGMLDLMDCGESRLSIVGAFGWALGIPTADRTRVYVGHRRVLCGAVHLARTPMQAGARCSEAGSLPVAHEEWWIEATPQEAGARLSLEAGLLRYGGVERRPLPDLDGFLGIRATAIAASLAWEARCFMPASAIPADLQRAHRSPRCRLQGTRITSSAI